MSKLGSLQWRRKNDLQICQSLIFEKVHTPFKCPVQPQIHLAPTSSPSIHLFLVSRRMHIAWERHCQDTPLWVAQQAYDDKRTSRSHGIQRQVDGITANTKIGWAAICCDLFAFTVPRWQSGLAGWWNASSQEREEAEGRSVRPMQHYSAVTLSSGGRRTLLAAGRCARPVSSCASTPFGSGDA